MSDYAKQALEEVYDSGRWAISGPSLGVPSKEFLFSLAFAEYCQTRYCVPTSHGSSALLIALEALGIGAGDEVIIPALTWVATGSAVTNVNAIPVFVDIDPATLCISPDAIDAACTSRTTAIIPVHLYSGMADMDEVLRIASSKNLAVIEDCAQAHGAQWMGRPAGSLGNIGVFSMQETKVLTSGEGGAAITNDKDLYWKLEQLRADGRIRVDGVLRGMMDLAEVGKIQGSNYCLSEFQAALLSANLKVLDEQHQQRSKNSGLLDKLLKTIEGVTPISCDTRFSKRVFYRYVIRVDRRAFSNQKIDVIKKALSAELGFDILLLHKPFNKNPLYSPLSKKRFNISQEHTSRLKILDSKYINAESAYETCVSFPHQILLGNEDHMNAIFSAFQKVKRYAATMQ